MVQIVETTHKTAGPFYLDYTAQTLYSLTKVNGEWKLYDLQIDSIQYILPDDLLTKEVDVPQVEKDIIFATIDNNMKYFNEENLDGYMSTLSEASPLYDDTKNFTSMIFEVFD